MAQPLLESRGANPMNLNCLVPRRRFLLVLQNAGRSARISLFLCVVSFVSTANAQTTNSFPLDGLPAIRISPESPTLELSAISDTVTLSWPAAASNFVVESSSDLVSGVWTRETNAVIEVAGDQTIATVPLTSEQQFFRLHGPQIYRVPIFSFAIFYNNLMEFTWTATFTINGRVHANGDIYVGSSSALTFNSPVTTAGGIYKTNWDGHTVSQMTGPVNYYGNPSLGTDVSRVPLLGVTNDTPATLREIINMPPPGEEPTSLPGRMRYYNLAGVVLLVSNTTVTVYVKNSLTNVPISLSVTNWGTNSVSLLTTFPFLSVTNSFIDGRELSKTVRSTQIDVAKYSQWLTTNSAVLAMFPPGSENYPIISILYVTDNRTTATDTDLFAVRLVNGSIIPTNRWLGTPRGWTVATPNPLYVWGHYNIGPGGSTVAGNTDTSKTFPASLVSDALTILSGNWSDSISFSNNLSLRQAVDTTVNAAILTGIVYSTDATSNHFSGGVMNVPRLLEDWASSGGTKNLTLNTSIVNLFGSVYATNWFKNPGFYYYAPTRNFSFDLNFTNTAKLPPGTPEVTITVPPQ